MGGRRVLPGENAVAHVSLLPTKSGIHRISGLYLLDRITGRFFAFSKLAPLTVGLPPLA